MFGRRRRELEEQLEAARREQAALGDRAARAEAEASAIKAKLEAAAAEREAAATELAARTAELDTTREASASELAALSAERDELRTALSQVSASAEAGDDDRPVDISWSLLLADLERRWPQPPGARSEVPDDLGEQLSRALAGELERLREEVGVDAEVTITKTVTPAHPSVFLLAALDLIGAVTNICERVTVTLDDELHLTGQAWEGRREPVDDARARALAAGAVVTPVEITDDEVRLTLLPGADAST